MSTKAVCCAGLCVGGTLLATTCFGAEYLSFTHGPDGFIWTYLQNVLVRIDPQDARVHVVGRVDPVGHPTFVENDLYLSGSEQLRRIRNITGKSTTICQLQTETN
jgi:hypothetical protein